MQHFDFIIVGSGIAGMSLALRLSKIGTVLLMSKTKLISGSTPWAQGGIAAVTNTNDSFQKHEEDTLKAGHFANNTNAVKILVEYAPQMIADLEKWGVKFSTETHLEGGHSFPRILNTGDSTGLSIATILKNRVMENKNITVKTHCFAMDFINFSECAKFSGDTDDEKTGIFFWDENTKQTESVLAEKIILAGGGAGGIFLHSSTPKNATGDAFAMAIRAKMEMQDLEIIQFHPTVLALGNSPHLLISEAVRGEGAKIVNEKKEEIINPLLPRDIVSKKIFEATHKGEKIFLDARNIADFEKKFPHIFSELTQKFGLFPEKDLLPISPAVHYFCGGIASDLHGRTSKKNVFAVGECACTGVHGKNRLASNSLLEAMVFSARIAEFLEKNFSKQKIQNAHTQKITLPSFAQSTAEDEKKIQKLQEMMEKFCGIERTKEGLHHAQKEIFLLDFVGTEAQNMKVVAEKILESAMKRGGK